MNIYTVDSHARLCGGCSRERNFFLFCKKWITSGKPHGATAGASARRMPARVIATPRTPPSSSAEDVDAPDEVVDAMGFHPAVIMMGFHPAVIMMGSTLR